MKVQLLLTAVSYKHKGVCLAGLTSDGSFMRPVYLAHSDFSIPWSSIKVGPAGRNLEPLDVVTLDVEPIALEHARHFEDRQCANARLKFVNQLTIRDLTNKPGYTKASKPVWFMSDSKPYVINAAPNRASLALVLAESVSIAPRDHDNSKHYISFTYQNRRFQSFSLTDLNRQRLYETIEPNAKYWLCISLALDYLVDDEIRNYKLVAGVWKASDASS